MACLLLVFTACGSTALAPRGESGSTQPTVAHSAGPVASTVTVTVTASTQDTTSAAGAATVTATTNSDSGQSGQVTDNPANLADFDATILAKGYTPRDMQGVTMSGGLKVSDYDTYNVWSGYGLVNVKPHSVEATAATHCGGAPMLIGYHWPDPGQPVYQQDRDQAWVVSTDPENPGTQVSTSWYPSLPECE